MKDAEFAGSQQRANTHYQLFVSSLTGGGQAKNLLDPNTDKTNAPQPVTQGVR